MRVLICLIVLGFGFSAVYATPRFKTNPQYWKVLEGSKYDSKLNTDPKVVGKHITKLVKADLSQLVKFCESIDWKSDDHWKIGNYNYLSRSECMKIAGHFLLVVRQFQDAKFVAKRPGVVCTGLRSGLKTQLDWAMVHKILQASPQITPCHGKWQERFRAITCLLSLIVKACDNAGGEAPEMQWPVLTALYESFHRFGQPYCLSKISSIALEMEYLKDRPDIEWFQETGEEKLYNRSKDRLGEFAYGTVLRLLSFKLIQSSKRRYLVPSDDMVKLFLPCLKPEDLQFFLEHMTDDELRPCAELEADKKLGHDFDSRSIILNKPRYRQGSSGALQWRSKLLNHWWEAMEDAERQQRIRDTLHFGTVEALMTIMGIFVENKIKENDDRELLKAFGCQIQACLCDFRKKQEFEPYYESKNLARLAGYYLSKADNLTLAEVRAIFELIKGGVFYNRGTLYRACFGRTLTLDPAIVSYLLERFRQQDHEELSSGDLVFCSYLEQSGLPWDAQTEEVLGTFDQVYKDMDYRFTYSSYFHQGNSFGGKGVVLDEDFTKALFNWIIAMEKDRKQRILHWIFAVWTDFNAKQFCQFYGCYLDTRPLKEDLDYVHERFCEDYARKYDFQLKDYEGLADDPRAKVLLECAKEFRPKYIEQQKRYNEASAAHLRQAIGAVSRLVNGQPLDDSNEEN